MAQISISVYFPTGNEARNIEEGITACDACDNLNIDAERYVVRLNNKTLVDDVTNPQEEISWSTTLRAGDVLTASTPRKVTAAARLRSVSGTIHRR